VKTVRVIKEPIHDYIGLSDLESALINDPLFLRLQHITQNGLAYLTYPSNRTSRFIHSLGAMHVGGEMILAILNSAERELKQSFLDAFTNIMEQAARDVSITLDKIERIVSSRSDVFYMHNGLDPTEHTQMSLIVMLQSVRIACVMHDLGHPPFSHTTESVLDSRFNSLQLQKATPESKEFGRIFTNLQRAEQGALHERVGTELVYYVFSNVDGELSNFGKFCFHIANRILVPGRAKEDPRGVLQCLHSILSGDSVDADRCDYVLRDGYASSFEFGEYDLTRILHNLRLSKNNEGNFEVASTTTAANAFESFFLERYRIWRWIVFHPNVVRAEIALSRALNILLEIAFSEDSSSLAQGQVRSVLKETQFAKLWKSFESPARYREYVSCDEPWLLTTFRSIQANLATIEWLPRRLAILRACLDFVLDRKKSSSCFATLWKRAEEYEQFAAAVLATAPAHKAMLNSAGLDSFSGNATEWLNLLIKAVLEKDLEYGEVECLRHLEDRLQARLGPLGFEGALLTKVLRFSPYKEYYLLDKSSNRVPLSGLSTVAANLDATWKKDIQFRCYWIALKGDSRGEFCVDKGSATPGREHLARCFLEALLDENEWISLRALIQAKEKADGRRDR